MKAGFILTGRRISFSNRPIHLFRISSSADLTVEAIDLNCRQPRDSNAKGGSDEPALALRKSAARWTINIQDEPARARFGI
jgi:hypothetical protein